MITCLTMDTVNDFMFNYGSDDTLNEELKVRYNALADILKKDSEGKKVSNFGVVDIVAYYISTIFWRVSNMGMSDIADKWKEFFTAHTKYRIENKLAVDKYPSF